VGHPGCGEAGRAGARRTGRPTDRLQQDGRADPDGRQQQPTETHCDPRSIAVAGDANPGGTTVTQPGPTTIPTSLPGRAANLPAPVRTRFITLNEVAPNTANWFLNLNGLRFDAASTENPRAGTVEDWVYVNVTPDTHPMHSHLVNFQVVGRTPFNAAGYQAANGGPDGVPGGIDPTLFITGPTQPPEPTERGFKETVKANPGQLTTIRARYELPAGVTAPQTYVYHCHIVEHEDNDMMRPYTVEP
jgi:spore coat protein A, manganese oxidase